MPILLDLFSGSLSWTKAFAELPGWGCISVDNDAKFTNTTIICDVLEWEVPERLHGVVGVVTIGVPCTAYSTANKKKSEEAQEATRMLWRRAFEITDLVLKPNGVFVCENPSRTELTGASHAPSAIWRRCDPACTSAKLTIVVIQNHPYMCSVGRRRLYGAISTCYGMISCHCDARRNWGVVVWGRSTPEQDRTPILIAWRSHRTVMIK